MTPPRFLPLEYSPRPPEEMRRQAAEFLAAMRRRRSVRAFSSRRPPREVIEQCVAAAATAPSGANMQPWHFAVVGSSAIKRQIREAAQREEREFYTRRAPQQWLADLEPIGTNADKPFLETAPWLIVLFAQMYRHLGDERPRMNYYPVLSAAIAGGILITGLHLAGLVCLPYTPSKMRFLNEVLGRPEGERPLLVVVTGYPADDARVPDIGRKSLSEVVTFFEDETDC